MHSLRAALAAVCLLLLVAPAIARADATGLIRGHVTCGAMPQPDATVTLAGEGSRFTTTTDRHGVYRFAEVPFGRYRLTVSAHGAAARTLAVTITGGAVATIDVALGMLREIAKTLTTAHAGVGGTPVSVNTISKAQIAASPHRDSLDRLIETVPGIVRFSYDEPIAHGFHGITYEIDGAPLPLATSSNFGQIFDPASIDSLEISTGAIPAEFGGSRAGAIVNIVSTRLEDLAPGSYGRVSIGAGSRGAALASLSDLIRFKTSELYLSANGQRTDRGIDTPTYDPIHDRSSNADQFLRYVLQFGSRATLAFDASNQLGGFQIPINTDAHNPIDPIFSPAATDDVQREYDRFFSLNFTTTSRDGDGVVQIIPYTRSTRIAYDGDLAHDVLALAPPFAHQIGLRQDRRAAYTGIRLSDFRASDRHAWKIGLDASRERFDAAQTFACYDPLCTLAPAAPLPAPPAPGYYAFTSAQNQAGSQLGVYAQDKWQPNDRLAVDAGLRYDRSTGYVGGFMLEPRIGINLSDGGRNIVHVYYGRFYAAPQLEDVRADCVLLNGCSSTPAYTLQPERDAYYEFGVAHQFDATMTGYFNIFSRSATNVLDTTQFLNTPLFAVFNNATGIDNGLEARLEDHLPDGDSWFASGTLSGAYAGGISGSTFLFPPDAVDTGGLPMTSAALLAPEDHDQTVAAEGAYTHRFGPGAAYFGTLQANFGTGYPVAFENVASGTAYTGRLPSHLTFDLALGRNGKRAGLGASLDVTNLLDDRYIVKIANGFNTTQVTGGRRVLVRLTAPF